jgi:hypothetical protein
LAVTSANQKSERKEEQINRDTNSPKYKGEGKNFILFYEDTKKIFSKSGGKWGENFYNCLMKYIKRNMFFKISNLPNTKTI